MKIYSMTATFGKLDHETLTLNPGLNVISASNEWGKSTWCAFLVAMLYGLETRAKSTRSTLAEKEHYAPWSGSPMSGCIDLQWNGRDITIERKTRGRVPLGEFRAYETRSGLEVPELNAANCGQMLLGVERSVFLRSSCIRLNDLNVTNDEALRRRLNNLVTTGDENSAADKLAKGLKELKNRVRYNRTGLLPQAEAERDRLEQESRELENLEAQSDKLLRRLDEIEDWRMALENHRAALRYASYQEDRSKLDQATLALEDAQRELENVSALCDSLPERETAQELLAEIERLENNRLHLQERLDKFDTTSREEEAPEYFAGMDGEEALHRVRWDTMRYGKLQQKQFMALVFGLALLCLGMMAAQWYPVPGLICACLGGAVVLMDVLGRLNRKRQLRELVERYGSPDPEDWKHLAEEYAAGRTRIRQNGQERQLARQELVQQLRELDNNILQATQNQGLDKCREDWQVVMDTWSSYDDALREYRRASSHLQTLESLLRTADAPSFPDKLTQTPEETEKLLNDCYAERRRLENLLGQCQGRKAALEDRETLDEKLSQLDQRIRQLEKTYDALTIAQLTLSDATAELQRRYAPRISRRAGEIMSRLTEGRYDRLSLGDDLAIRAGAQREDTLHEALWRSDGTVDQLYLALRLAVAEELLPHAPLILDDALVRFDDIRLKAALDILKEEAKQRQVILFTCHSREKNML